MNPFTVLKNFSPFHFFILFYFIFFFHFSYQPVTSLYFAICIYKSLPFTSLTFTFCFLLPSLSPLFYTFLTLVLKIRVLPWEVPIALSGSWFQSVMDLITKEYFPMSFVFWLWFSNDDRPYLSTLAPVACPLSPSRPSLRYTLCRARTFVLSSYAEPKIPSLNLPNDAQI
jgi:hypothetical protein